jgi:hypothetical protein
MKIGTTISTLIAVALVATPMTALAKGGQGASQANSRSQTQVGQRNLDRDRLHTRDRASVPSHDRDRIQDRTHAPDSAKPSNRNSYGSKATSSQASNARQKQVQTQTATSREEWAQIEATQRRQLQTGAGNEGSSLAPTGNGNNGESIVSVLEQNQHREQLRLDDSDSKERTRYEAKHQEQVRVKSQGADSDDVTGTELSE